MTHLHQKWMNVFIRYTIDGEPFLGVFGVLRIVGKSTGSTLYGSFKKMVEGEIFVSYKVIYLISNPTMLLILKIKCELNLKFHLF